MLNTRASTVEYRKLASTNLEVSRISFGCWTIGGHGWGRTDDRISIAAIHRALDLGINFFDTADVYGFGHSEEILSSALGEERKRVIIATKFGIRWNNQGGIVRDTSPGNIVAALENSLRRLRLDCVSLYQIHWHDGYTPVSRTLEALARCQEAGKIQHVGCCNYSPELLRQAMKVHPIVSLQAPYNILDRKMEATIMPCCDELGVSMVAYSPLAQGLLSGKFGPDAEFGEDDIRHKSIYFHEGRYEANLEIVARLKEIGSRYGKTPAQVAIRWILDNPKIVSAITGIRTPMQIEENVGGLNWELLAEDWDLLAHVSTGKLQKDPDGG